MNAKKVIAKIIFGAIEGLIIYVAFAFILPALIGQILGVTVGLDVTSFILLMGIFISLGVISSCLKPCIGIIFSMISFLLGVLMVLSITGFGTIETSLEMHGFGTVIVIFEFKQLLLLIIGFLATFSIIQAFERIAHSEE